MRVRVVLPLMLACVSSAAGSLAADDDKAAPKSSHDHLKVFEPLVGQWEGTHASGDLTARITFTIDWMLDKQFIREEIRSDLGGKEFTVITIYGWDDKAGAMTTHAFTSNGASGAALRKFVNAAPGKVAHNFSLEWSSGRKVVGKRVAESPRPDRLVVTFPDLTQNGEPVPATTWELKRKK